AAGGDRGYDLAILLGVERVDIVEPHLALQLGGLRELGDDLGLPAHEEVPVGMPGDGRVEHALSGAPEFEPAARQLDLQRRAELLANAAKRAAGRSAAQLVRFEQEDVGLALGGEVVSDRAAGYPTADDRSPDPLHSNCNLREVHIAR